MHQRNVTTSSECCCYSGLRKIYLYPFFLYFDYDYSDLSLTPRPLGTPALTSRNMKDEEMEKVAEFIDLGMQIAFEMKDEMIKTGAVGNSGHVTAKVRH